MTKKDFVAIAAAIRAEVSKINPELELLRASSLVAVANGIADHAASVNARFDRRLFLRACGLDDLNTI